MTCVKPGTNGERKMVVVYTWWRMRMRQAHSTALRIIFIFTYTWNAYHIYKGDNTRVVRSWLYLWKKYNSPNRTDKHKCIACAWIKEPSYVVFFHFFFSSLTNIIKSECVCVCVIQKCEHMYSIPYKENRAHVCRGKCVSSGYKYILFGLVCRPPWSVLWDRVGVNRFSHTCTYMDTSTNTSYVYIYIYICIYIYLFSFSARKSKFLHRTQLPYRGRVPGKKDFLFLESGHLIFNFPDFLLSQPVSLLVVFQFLLQ